MCRLTSRPDAPVAQSDEAWVGTGTFPAINVLGIDRDIDGALDPTTVAIVQAPGHGVTVVNAGGTIGYSPASNYSGYDSFTYSVADDRGAHSNPATVSLVVTGVLPGISPVMRIENTFFGTTRGEEIYAGGGIDFMFGLGGNDVVFGGDGHDELRGGAGDDLLLGEQGSDRLLGGFGKDVLLGGIGIPTFLLVAKGLTG